MESLTGQLLIAGATLPDPNFSRTVVLVCAHNPDGALGLVLNRPGELLVADVAPDIAALTADEATVDSGGPVQPNGLIVLAEFEDPSLAGLPVLGSLGLVGEGTDLEDLDGATRRVRVFAGHAGWGPGQLDAEMEREDWFVHPADIDDDVFAPGAEELWSRVLGRMGGHYALVARMPVDPTVN